MCRSFFQPILGLLFSAILLAGCGNRGSVKPISNSFDSIVIDTTAKLGNGDVCKIHLKMHLFKGKNAAALNDSLLRMGILQPDYMAISYEPLRPKSALSAFVRRLVADEAMVFKRIRSREPNTQPLLYNTGSPLEWLVIRNIAPNGHWIQLQDIYNEKDRGLLPGEILQQLADNLNLEDTTAVRAAGYFVGINAYATDNFMLFDDSVRFVYVPGDISQKAVNVTLNR